MVTFDAIGICGSTPPVKERIKVFGKTAPNLPKLIKSVLSLDVNVYSENDLFVCTNPCYKRLLKLEKLEKNIFDLKQELTSSFDGNVETARVKRLRKYSDTVPECSTTREQNKLSPGVSRSLKFVSPAHTTCTSCTYNPNRAFQKPYHVVYNAFGHLKDPGIGYLLLICPRFVLC